MGLTSFSLYVRAESLTYPDLVQRMTDLELLPLLPPVGETGGMDSSYDRSSKYDPATDKYINWGADRDGSGVIREEGDTEVLAEIKGPGCIWRIWSADAEGGFAKIYLDGDEKPVVDLPFRTYFDPIKGPFPWPNLACPGVSFDGQVVGKITRWVPGGNIYVPIPFQKSCKIVGERETKVPHSGWGQYFQFTYTQFAPGTIVPNFSLPMSSEDTAALDKANTVLGQCGQDPAGDRPGQAVETPAITVAPGGNSTVVDLKGPQAITAIKVKLDLPKDPDAQRTLLRQLTICITWDDEKNPSVWSPLGDFFGTIGGSQPYKTLTTGLLADGTLYSFWYMPFASHAVVEIGNDSGAPVPLTCTVVHAPLTKPIAQYGRFHAKWHRDALPIDRPDRMPDWTILKTAGRGRYVGTMLHVWNPHGGWWGEGDDKFFIDGEKFPSYFGTGSEDYFGYAWGAPSYFSRPYHAQPLNESNIGNVDNIRWHIADSVPFQASFDGYIEKYFPDVSPKPYGHQSLFAVETYWYLSADGTDPFTAISVDQRVGYWTPPVGTYVEPGDIEGEDLSTVNADDLRVLPQVEETWDLKPGAWSNDKELLWSTARPGVETLKLKVPVAHDGTYQVLARLGAGPNGGIYQLSIDGKDVGVPADLFAEKISPLALGTITLPAGDHILGATLTGNNPARTQPGALGEFRIDYLKLVRVP